jgi:NADPH2:quinone reductase
MSVRAARLHAYGEPLKVDAVELPEPGEGEVLVELKFAGVNPIDSYIAQGSVAPDAPLPRTLGGEGAGTVGGRDVLVTGEGLGAVRDGVWAEAAIVPEVSVLPLPEGVEVREAAAMGIAGLTAWEVVHELARVAEEDRVLVLGASGGVGSMIVSLAHAAGAEVWGQTGSEEKADAVRQQGADSAVVASADQLGAALAEFEPTVVFDPLGDGFVRPAIDSLAVRGRLVSFGTAAGPEVGFNMQALYRKSLIVRGYGGMQLSREERRAGLAATLEALRRGDLRVRVDEVLPLEQVNEAFERLAQRKVDGKLLLATSG